MATRRNIQQYKIGKNPLWIERGHNSYKMFNDPRGLVLHRPCKDGPAKYTANGAEYYYENGELHNLWGAAVTYDSGRSPQYWVRGERVKDMKEVIARRRELRRTGTITGCGTKLLTYDL